MANASSIFSELLNSIPEISAMSPAAAMLGAHHIYRNTNGQDNLVLEMLVPSFDKDSITAEIEYNVLTIRGKQTNWRYGTGDYIKTSRIPNTFTERFTIPPHYVVNSMRVEDGVLIAHFDRVKESGSVGIKID